MTTTLEESMRVALIPYVGSMPMDKFEALVQAVTLVAARHSIPPPPVMQHEPESHLREGAEDD